MKQEIKKLVFLILMLSLFSSSQEETCIIDEQPIAVPVVTQNRIENNNPENRDSDFQLMPMSRFILVL
ncbi:MAG: hypothetical protein H7Z13_04325 [Ferruginibacter sp.]|nr:hypothetical protein [Ferruginibacter sp.]